MAQFDFSKVESAESNGNFLTPGNYKLAPIDAKYDKEGKTPFVKITFGNEQGTMFERFFISEKAVPRLQHLHEVWFGKKVEKIFDSEDSVGTYFEAVFNTPQAKAIYHNVEVQGEEAANGNIYAKFGYSGFVLPEDAKLGAFERGSSEWMTKVKKQTSTAPATDTVNLGNAMPPAASQQAISDLPF